ncbi:MAG: DUF2934 domain-containing protein [Acidobacteriia bacterium]|nr:DUF2934 domain-containing protein [Terriglobia bacterium]
MRTNPKSGSAVPRVARRRTAQPASPESVALAATSEQTGSEQDIRGEIARLAYLFWEERGGHGGSSEEDWLRAEQEILTRSRG